MFVKDHRRRTSTFATASTGRVVEIATGEALDGDLPPRAARLVREWSELRRADREENWRRVERMLPPEKIDPLP